MAVTLERISGKGKFLGHKSNLEGYTIQEDATPLFGHDSSGGAGSIVVPVTEVEDSVLFINNEVRLEDSEKGYTTGLARRLGSEDGQLTITSDSRLAKFVVQRTAAPVSGTLGQVLEYYFDLCGIDDNYIIDPIIADRPVAYPGWTDNVWTRLKQICVAQQVEIALVSGNVVVRIPRGRNANMSRDSSVDWDIDTDQLAAYVEVAYYNYAPVVNSTVFPVPHEVLPTVITLASEEAIVVELQTSTSLTSLVQPSATTSAMLGMETSPNSSYYVVNDGTPGDVSPTTWYERGGYVYADIDPEDNTRILLTIRAPWHPTEGSYRLAFRGMGEEYQNSLHIAGTGIGFERRVIRSATGANPALIVDDEAQTIDNPAISTAEQAWAVALDAACAFAGATFNMTVTSNGIHREEELYSARYLTANEFNAEFAGKTMDQFNAMFSGYTVNEFNFIYEERFENEFVNQAFGNIGGARITYRDNIFRIRSATITESGIDYSAERDIMAEDFNAAWAGMSMAQFNAQWAGMSMDEFSIMPLRRT